MPRRCYVVPGFAGSELHFAPPKNGKVYVNPVALYRGGLLGMQLAGNGVSSFYGPEWEMVAGPGLSSYFGDLVTRLTNELAPHGYQVVDYGWDWRKSFIFAGAALAERIRQDATPAEPASIVCHSTGGLVARWAWYRLGQTGQQNLLRRIVTLGSPHRGTYASVRVFSLGDPTITGIRDAANSVMVLGGFLGFLLGSNIPSHLAIENVFASFPCLYDLFPLVDAQSQQSDPNRERLFNAANWPSDRNIQALHLSEANDLVQPWMRNPLSMPPQHVMTCVAGTGHRTPFRLIQPSKLGEMSALDVTLLGDATVPLESSLVAGHPQHIVNVEHFALTMDERVLSRVTGWVLEERTESTPVPPPLNIPGVPQTQVLPPPMPSPPETVYVDPQGTILPDPGALPPGGVFSGFGSFSSGGNMPYRVSFIFDQKVGPGQGSWSENYWNLADSFSDAQAFALSLAGKLALLHGRTTPLSSIRVSKAPPAGVVTPIVRQVVEFPYQNATNNKVTATQHSDYPTQALCIEVGDNNQNSVRQWVRGIRDEFVDKGGFLQTDLAAFTDAFNEFAAELLSVGKKWCVRTLNPTVAPKDVVSITAAGVVTTVGAHQMATGNRARIVNCQVNKYPNKVWKVQEVTGETEKLQMLQWNPPLPFVPVEGENIKIRLQSYHYVQITSAEYVHATKKNVGNVSKRLSGKQKKARR